MQFEHFCCWCVETRFSHMDENKKLKYSGFVSERQEKICITYKGKRRQFAGCVYLRRRKRHLIFDVLYKVNVIFFRFIQFHLTVSLAHSIDTPRPLSHFTPNLRRGFAVRSIAGLLKCVYEYAATYRNYFNIQFD